MRPIKFRAWNTAIAQMGSALPLRVWTDDIAQRPEAYHADIDNLVLMQFTGLHDKNGKEIYEGDIVSSPTMRGTIVWSDNGSWSIHGYRTQEDWASCEVIGNIFENPELLVQKAREVTHV